MRVISSASGIEQLVIGIQQYFLPTSTLTDENTRGQLYSIAACEMALLLF